MAVPISMSNYNQGSPSGYVYPVPQNYNQGADIYSSTTIGVIHSKIGEYAISSWAKGINLGGPGTTLADGTFGSNLFFGVQKNTVEGSPASPCIELQYANKWRFKWTIASGSRSISVKTKQVSNLTPRPSLTVRANAGIGIPTDLVASASPSTDWVTIGPISFIATGTDATWVELKNNVTSSVSPTSAFFDHIVVT